MQKAKKTKETAASIPFKEEYAQKQKVRAINESSWFCMVWAMLLMLTGTYASLCTQGLVCILCSIAALAGLALFLVGIVLPLKLYRPIKAIQAACSLFGNAVLRVFLFPLYLLMSLINALRHKKYTEKHGFKNWEDRDRVQSSFCDFSHANPEQNKNSVLRTVISVLGFFAANGMYIVIPVIILLLIIGAVMFFVSSNAVFSFVYTLW